MNTADMSLLYLVDSRSAVSRTPRNQTWSDLTDQALIWAIITNKHSRCTDEQHYRASAFSSDNGDAVAPCEETCLFRKSIPFETGASLCCRSGVWAGLIAVGVLCGYSNWSRLLSVTETSGYASCDWSTILLLRSRKKQIIT